MVSVGRLPKSGPTHRGESQGMPWTILPLHHNVAAPPLPSWREWCPATVAWWTHLWRSPQASQWDSTGMSLWVLALLTDDVLSGRLEMKRASAEIRQHGDRHGLSPKSMVNLRWRLASESASEAPLLPADEAPSIARRRRLMVAQDGGAA